MYAGGFIGKEGDVRHVRFNLESRCVISDESGSQLSELFVGAPCRSEYTIPRRNFFQIPSDEFRMAFSRTQVRFRSQSVPAASPSLPPRANSAPPSKIIASFSGSTRIRSSCTPPIFWLLRGRSSRRR